MIQRIQSILLALVVIFGGLFFILPILSFENLKAGNHIIGEYEMFFGSTFLSSNWEIKVLDNIGVGVLQGLIIVFSTIVIFMYKNRQLQMKLLKLNILFIALQISAIAMYSDSVKTAIGSTVNDVLVGFEFGAVIPVISLILTYLAIRFIKKDDNLVRAADRLR